jgi:hypothetical protein
MRKILFAVLGIIMFFALAVRADNLVYSGNKYLVGDVNGDGVVNIVDVSAVSKQVGQSTASPYGFGSGKYNPDADMNNDGVINIVDVSIVSNHYSQTSAWKLGNRDFEVINATEYWGLFGFGGGPGQQEWTFDNKGHCKIYVKYIGSPANIGGLHEGSKPYGWGTSPWTYTRIRENRAMYVDLSLMIDWAYVDWLTGFSHLRLDIWLDIEAPGKTDEGCVTIVFDWRETVSPPVGRTWHYEGNIGGNTWIDYITIFSSMSDDIWYNFTGIYINDYIFNLKNYVPDDLPTWKWIQSATCYVRDVDISMEVFEGHGIWYLDYLYFYAHD